MPTTVVRYPDLENFSERTNQPNIRKDLTHYSFAIDVLNSKDECVPMAVPCLSAII